MHRFFNRPRSLALALSGVLALSSIVVAATSARERVSDGGEPPTSGPEADEDTAKAPRHPPLFYLRDGGKVAGKAAFGVLNVRTRYGNLHVPLKDLIQVRFARRVDPGVEKRIKASISRMGSDDFDERESAMEVLRKIGPDALPLLRRASDSENEEIKNRAELLVDELESRESEEEDAAPESEINPLEGDRDEVVTRRFTIRGHVVEDRFLVESRYGRLALSASDLVGIFFRQGGKMSQELEIPGTKTVPASWVKTEVTLRKGQRLRISAEGRLHVARYSLTSGPGGTRRYSGKTFENFPMLSLVGKVGAKGKAFLVGADYRSRVSTTGTLYLGVVPFRSYAATGNYTVEVEASY